MAKAPPGGKARFVDDLQCTLDSLPAGDIVLVLGDFNARVETRNLVMMYGEKLGDHMGLTLVMKLENSSLNCVLLTI